jgi:hypothetical protein
VLAMHIWLWMLWAGWKTGLDRLQGVLMFVNEMLEQYFVISLLYPALDDLVIQVPVVRLALVQKQFNSPHNTPLAVLYEETAAFASSLTPSAVATMLSSAVPSC